MKINGSRFVVSPAWSALGLPAGEYWAVPDSELRRVQNEVAELQAEIERLRDQAEAVVGTWDGVGLYPEGSVGIEEHTAAVQALQQALKGSSRS